MVAVLPDVEAITVAFLKAYPTVTSFVAARVSSELPTTPTFPLVTVRRIGGIAESYPLYIDRAMLQVEAWGRNKAEANSLARTVQVALHDMTGTYSAGVVSSITDSMGMSWQPDVTFSPAQPRYLWGVVVTTHPV